ncbi:MAG: hypothetical protein ACLFTT_05440 [Candidatus Hydrogenedentota bacterium]
MRNDIDDQELDELIESALSSEPLQSAPCDLAQRVDERLRVQALIDRERARFRTSMAMMAVAFVAIIVGGVVFVAFTHLRSLMLYGAPGAKGRFDYLVSEMLRTFGEYTGAYSLGISLVLALGAVALLFIPRGGRMRHH